MEKSIKYWFRKLIKENILKKKKKCLRNSKRMDDQIWLWERIQAWMLVQHEASDMNRSLITDKIFIEDLLNPAKNERKSEETERKMKTKVPPKTSVETQWQSLGQNSAFKFIPKFWGKARDCFFCCFPPKISKVGGGLFKVYFIKFLGIVQLEILEHLQTNWGGNSSRMSRNFSKLWA